eukprot:Gregarina_sp_Pseudo_9__1597@NODE_2076_length_1167_cov_5_617908_g1917_i0_p1_GENE_NODE_2076_length_1167_cov_5_617908_g1917_i0NODE_2076_length_1167_cov_5_617908_g1917_i0_p1_ORF_typecomplete_len204_score40_62COPI_assoc/PF08507_10/5_7e16Phage_holin_5_1/PF06946_11/4e03Phage_holin_5_1/PF06946_11/0_045PhoR/PF11808_8/99PhoR/PF11808_8/2_9_NODE_2076_length_1167_cov_5_617908_g1917_i05561128
MDALNGQDFMVELRLLMQFLEGPVALRFAAGVAGAALAAGAALLTLEDVYTLSPPQMILRAYTILFGAILVVNECKTASVSALQSYQQWVFKWFPFLSVMAGKGAFMLLVGAVGMAYHDHYLVALPAGLLAAVGACYLLVHFAKRQELEEAIDKSMNIAAISTYYTGSAKYQRAGMGGSYQPSPLYAPRY